MNFLNGSIWRISFFCIFYYGTSSLIKQEVTYFAAMRHFAFFLFPSRFAATETKLNLGVVTRCSFEFTQIYLTPSAKVAAAAALQAPPTVLIQLSN